MATPTAARTKGTVTQVLGNVVDIEFPPDKLPAIYNAVEVQIEGQDHPLTLEVEQLLGNNWVRCVGMGPTDGLSAARRPTTPARPSRCRSARRRLAASLTCSASQWTTCQLPAGAPR